MVTKAKKAKKAKKAPDLYPVGTENRDVEILKQLLTDQYNILSHILDRVTIIRDAFEHSFPSERKRPLQW